MLGGILALVPEGHETPQHGLDGEGRLQAHLVAADEHGSVAGGGNVVPGVVGPAVGRFLPSRNLEVAFPGALGCGRGLGSGAVVVVVGSVSSGLVALVLLPGDRGACQWDEVRSESAARSSAHC